MVIVSVDTGGSVTSPSQVYGLGSLFFYNGFGMFSFTSLEFSFALYLGLEYILAP